MKLCIIRIDIVTECKNGKEPTLTIQTFKKKFYFLELPIEGKPLTLSETPVSLDVVVECVRQTGVAEDNISEELPRADVLVFIPTVHSEYTPEHLENQRKYASKLHSPNSGWEYCWRNI